MTNQILSILTKFIQGGHEGLTDHEFKELFLYWYDNDMAGCQEEQYIERFDEITIKETSLGN
jgi:hypothetical protein